MSRKWNAGDSQRASAIQCLEGRQHQITDGCEEYRGVQCHRRAVGGTLHGAAPSASASSRALSPRVITCTSAPCAVRLAR